MNYLMTQLHQHAWAGAGLEELLESFGLPHQWVDFLMHFLIDTVNLFVILIVVMFGVSLLQSWVPFDRLQAKLSALGSVWGYALAILLGVVSPFCSCTIIPVVMGFLSVGVPVQTALCYLTAAALLNGSAILTLFSALGSTFGWFYVFASLLITIGSSLLMRPFSRPGCVLDQQHGHHHHEHDHSHEHHHDHDACCCDAVDPTSRWRFALHNVGHVLRSTWIFMLISVALSSAVMSFVPMEMLQNLLGSHNLFSPLLAGLIGIPLHGDVFAILPLLRILQPINFGAAAAFAFGTMAISIPEALLLSRVFRAKTVAAYALILSVFSIIVGYLSLFFA